MNIEFLYCSGFALKSVIFCVKCKTQTAYNLYMETKDKTPNGYIYLRALEELY